MDEVRSVARRLTALGDTGWFDWQQLREAVPAGVSDHEIRRALDGEAIRSEDGRSYWWIGAPPGTQRRVVRRGG